MKKIDLWVGRHMTARRWIIAWGMVLAASIFVAVVVNVVLVKVVWALDATLAVLMVWGHARRLR